MTEWELQCDLNAPLVAMETKSGLPWAVTAWMDFSKLGIFHKPIFMGMIGELKPSTPFVGQPSDGETLL